MDVTMQDGMATPPHTSPKSGFLPSLPKDNHHHHHHPASSSSADPEKGGEDKKVEIEVVPTAAIDLDSYLGNYQGLTKITRLEFIGEYCPPLRIDAFRACLRELQGTLNTEKYLALAKKLNDHLAAVGLPLVQVDQDWVAKTNRNAVQKQEKLDNELKNYRHNMIKESIRMGYNDMGDYFYQRGDLPNALKNYVRTRDYCTSSKHITTMCLNIIKISVELGNFSYVLNYVSKAESTPDMKEQPLLAAKLKAASALAHLDGKKYRQAARLFIDVPFEIDVAFNEVISPQDIGTYGGLCALASFDRAEIKSKIIDNPVFRQFLELSPTVRQIIEDFYHSRYSSCLKNLQQIRPELLLDIHLYEHVKGLYESIRKKALIQYFSPFQSVSLIKMAETFGVTVQALETELAALIMDNQIEGRIDSFNKVLYARKADHRATTFEKSVEMGDQYLRSTKALLLRVNMMKADFIIKGGRSDGFKI